MDKLTTRQRQVLNFIRRSLQKNGIAPTRAEIADAIGFQSKNAALDHLKALERKGFIKRAPNKHRGIRIARSLLASPLKTQEAVLEQAGDGAPA